MTTPYSDPNASIPEVELQVKELIGGTHSRREFKIRLQGEVLLAMEKRAKRLGLSNQQYFRSLVERDLVKEGELPNWWYTRKGNIL